MFFPRWEAAISPFRSIAARFALAAVTVTVIVGVMGFIFVTAANRLTDVSASIHVRELPLLNAAHRVVVAARDVSQVASAIARARTPSELRTAAERLDDSSRALVERLDALAALPDSHWQAADLRREHRTLVEAAEALVRLTGLRLERETQLARSLAELRRRREAPDGSAAAQAVIAAAALGATAPSALAVAQARTAVTGLLPDLPAATRDWADSLVLGAEGLLALRTAVLDLDARTDNLVRRLAEGGVRFDSLAAALAVDAERAADRHRASTEAEAGRMRVVFATALGIAVGAVLLLSLLMQRDVVRPLQRLRRQMQAGLAGGPVTLDTAGPVELTDMAAAARDYIGMIEQRTADLDRSQRRLAEQTAALETVNAISADAMVGAGTDGVIRWANRAAADLVGHPEGSLPGRPLRDLLPAWVVDRHGGLAEAFLAGPDASLSLTDWRSLAVRHRDGRDIPVMATVSVTTVGGDRQVTVTARDMTETRRIEADLENARRAAEQANAAKSVFLANMSHELRTPLTGVIGMADLIADTALDAQQRDCIDTLRTSARTLLAVLNDLLDLSKIDAGRLDLETVDLDLADVVRSVARLFRPMAEGRGVALSLDLPAGDAAGTVVKGDPTRLQQVLFNLVSNAVKFTEAGEVRLELEVTPGAGAGPSVRLAVADTGIGMTDEQIARLFVPFAQGDSSMTRRYGGTGLGLSIAHRLVALMGGRIEVESRLGQGSRFTVRLSLPAGDAAGIDRARAGWSAGGAGRRLRVLVADDNEVNRSVLRQYLERHGHTVLQCADGREAVERLRTAAEPPDLVLMDVHMPEMDGPTATRAIRALPGAAGRLPVIALTADALPAHAAAFREAGMDDVLVKPVDWGRLQAVLDACAAGAPPPSAAAPQPPPPPAPPPPAAPLLDAARLGELEEIMGGAALDDLVRRFVRECDVQLASLRTALAAADGERARTCAHTLKGFALNMGAVRLGQTAAAVEAALRGGDGHVALDRLEATAAETGAAFEARGAAPAAAGTMAV
ncbi:ATP-binding protein [Azospirillum sp. ST 5-10]|uniref:hybrid sensor histidine kinase/response regulator n=1 Tax=unclassified Azospirillum TaxID=2630922 RepID=UPI003F49CC88